MLSHDRKLTQRVKSVRAMHRLAAGLVRDLAAGDVLLLIGELGSGKTTFVRGLARALGVSGVASPSFPIVVEHLVARHDSIKNLVHIDLYRLTEQQVQVEGAVQEALREAQGSDALTVIEWADRLGSHVPAGARTISFAPGASSTERLVAITN